MAKREDDDVTVLIDHPNGLITVFAVANAVVGADHYSTFEDEGSLQNIHTMLGDIRPSFRFVPIKVQYGLLPFGMLVVKS